MLCDILLQCVCIWSCPGEFFFLLAMRRKVPRPQKDASSRPRQRRAETEINFVLKTSHQGNHLAMLTMLESQRSERNYLAFGTWTMETKIKAYFFRCTAFIRFSQTILLVTANFTTQKVIKEMEIIAPATARSTFQFALLYCCWSS